MDELFQKLLESDILTLETKKELEEAIKESIEEAKTAARSEVEKEIRAQLAEQWVDERDRLVEALDSKVDDFLISEVAELKADIERFRDLEAEHAEKLVEAKKDLAEQLQKDMGELVNKLDSFLEIRLNAELEELTEDIVEVRKLQFGKKLYEAFADEFKKNYNDEDSAIATLRDTESRLDQTVKALSESNRKLGELERGNKMREVLAPLSGRSKEIMGAILKNVPTHQLDEGYKTFIGRVLKESSTETVKTGSEKESKVLAEQKKPEVVKESVVKTGDDTPPAAVKVVQVNESIERLKKLSGITN